MQFTEEAAEKLSEYIENNRGGIEGIRIMAASAKGNLYYRIYWEKDSFPDDEVIIQNGLKIFLNSYTSEVLKEQTIFYAEKDGKKGLFIMKSVSGCSTCSTVCF